MAPPAGDSLKDADKAKIMQFNAAKLLKIPALNPRNYL